MPSTDDIRAALERVPDPELGRDGVSLRMIRKLAVNGDAVS